MENREELLRTCLSKAAAICSKAEKSPLAIQKKCLLWGLNEDEAELVVAQLFEQNFLNQERFTSSYVLDKVKFNKWGRIKIAYQLKAEGISSSAIDAALENIDEDIYIQNLQKILKAKIDATKAKDEYELKAKVVQHARSKGFESDLIFSVYNSILNNS